MTDKDSLTLAAVTTETRPTTTLLEAAALITTLRREADHLDSYTMVPCQSENAWHARDYRRWAQLIDDLLLLIGSVSQPLSEQQTSEQEPSGAALLPVDASASVNTETLPIEVRMAGGADERRIDEIVASNAHVHLEQMSDTEYTLIVETITERACFSIHACNSRSHIRTTESWKDQIGSGNPDPSAERAVPTSRSAAQESSLSSSLADAEQAKEQITALEAEIERLKAGTTLVYEQRQRLRQRPQYKAAEAFACSRPARLKIDEANKIVERQRELLAWLLLHFDQEVARAEQAEARVAALEQQLTDTEQQVQSAYRVFRETEAALEQQILSREDREKAINEAFLAGQLRRSGFLHDADVAEKEARRLLRLEAS